MDIQKLRTQIFDKTGVRVDATDPIFTLVALNEAVLEESIAVFNQAQEKNNGELDERIGKLVVLHRNIVAATENLVERANHAHKAAALTAAAEVRTEILESTKTAMNDQMQVAVSLIKAAAADMATTRAEAKANSAKRWFVASVQAVIGGIVAGGMVLLFMHFMR